MVAATLNEIQCNQNNYDFFVQCGNKFSEIVRVDIAKLEEIRKFEKDYIICKVPHNKFIQYFNMYRSVLAIFTQSH